MKHSLTSGLIALSFLLSPIAFAQQSMALEEACFGDIDLTDYVVQMAQGEAASTDLVSTAEAAQIANILNAEENAALALPEKLQAVMQACAEGRILQQRNQQILSQQ